jgi:hypothetical protein
MKYLFIALLLCSQLCSAQDKALILGDSVEQAWQHNVKVNSPHGYGALFYHAKLGNLMELMTYAAQYCGCSSHIELSDGPDWATYSASCGLHGESLKAKAFCDPSLTMDKVVITGPAQQIVKLFLFYWQGDFKAEKLKRGVTVYQDVASDRITFSWAAKEPAIIITGSPMVKVPWARK